MSCLYSELHRQIYARAQQQVLPRMHAFVLFCFVFCFFGPIRFMEVVALRLSQRKMCTHGATRSFLAMSFGERNRSFACSMSGRDPDGRLCLLFCRDVRNAVFVGVGGGGKKKRKMASPRGTDNTTLYEKKRQEIKTCVWFILTQSDTKRSPPLQRFTECLEVT